MLERQQAWILGTGDVKEDWDDYVETLNEDGLRPGHRGPELGLRASVRLNRRKQPGAAAIGRAHQTRTHRDRKADPMPAKTLLSLDEPKAGRLTIQYAPDAGTEVTENPPRFTWLPVIEDEAHYVLRVSADPAFPAKGTQDIRADAAQLLHARCDAFRAASTIGPTAVCDPATGTPMTAGARTALSRSPTSCPRRRCPRATAASPRPPTPIRACG